MKRILIVLLLTLAFPVVAHAQRLNLDFSALAAKATETVDVTLDGDLLRMASKFLSSDDSEERNIRDIVSRLEGIYVRSYTFDTDHAYDPAVADRVRAQLGATWRQMVNVRSRDKENVDVFVDMRNGAVAGLVVISAEPREFTVVNIVGPIDLDKLAKLEGEFGIPHIHDRASKSDEKKGGRP